MYLYVETNQDYTDVINVSTIEQGTTCFKVELRDAEFHFDKLQGYKIEYVGAYEYHLRFDQTKYNEYLAGIKEEQSIEEANKLLEELKQESVLKNASDEDAYIMRYLYEEWKPDTEYFVGDRRIYNDTLYKCKQNHTSQANHTVDLVPALWDIINGDETKGTLENPIIIPEQFSSMVYTKGKYYKEGDAIYLMNREGMKDGEEISLAYKPSELVDHYFTIVSDTEPTVPEDTEVPEFKQPTGAHDAYNKGDVVMSKGKKYESLIDNNTYSPEEYSVGWKEII